MSEREIWYEAGGVVTIKEGGREQTLIRPTPDEIYAAVSTFFGPDLTLPDEFPMQRMRLFLIATNRKAQLTDFLDSLPEPMRELAKEEFEYATNFVPDGALGKVVQTALDLNDADYAEAVRAAHEYSIKDYGAADGLLPAATKVVLDQS